MVDHFHDHVMSVGKIGGKARTMVVCSDIERAIQYYHAFKAYLVRKSPYEAIVAFSGEFEFKGGEPLLHTMYVDKVLSGIKAVQTLSRLNRAHPEKRDVFVLDFQNNTDTVTQAFSDYYRTTILSEETDPNKLHDLKLALDTAQVYSQDQIDSIVELFIAGASREKLDPILDVCVATYLEQLDEDGQVDFKSKAKIFTRA